MSQPTKNAILAITLVLFGVSSVCAQNAIQRLPQPQRLQPAQGHRVAQLSKLIATNKNNTAQAQNPLPISEILADLNRKAEIQQQRTIASPWWERHVHASVRSDATPASVDVNKLLQLTMSNSEQLKVYSEVPLIRETAITEADAAFDWTAFADGLWDDTSDPVGNTLTVGGGRNRFNDHNANVTAGVRRKTTSGADLEIGQRLGHQNNNSIFFVPNDQATSRLTVSFTQPLLRGRGKVYNTSLTMLAQIDTDVASDEFERQLESHLLEVVRAYWALYLERGLLAQQVLLYSKSRAIVAQLERRGHIDAQRTQLASARAALAERRSALVRAQAAVKNAETRMRGLSNAPELGEPDATEIVPLEQPTLTYIPFGLREAMEVAVQHRSEVLQALKQIRAGGIRLDMAKHEMLPLLNAVTELYVSGLRGESDIARAWEDQYTTGAPSYSIGLQFELPIGRRAFAARDKRRRIELRQLEGQYRSTLETVRNEVEIAVREVRTSYDEMHTKYQSMTSAKQEAETLERRWKQLADAESSGALMLEALLRAQERVTKAEGDFLTAQMTYNLSLMNVKRAMGVLIESENGETLRGCECGVPSLELDKHDLQPTFSELPVDSYDASH
ncbi:MAG: TolC family protein [Planctomycetales bacterium]|nr:TolC family protein [Planctomycetales bacterium]